MSKYSLPLSKDENQSSNKFSSIWVIVTLSVLILALIIAYFTVPPFQDFANNAYRVFSSGDRERISKWVKQFGIWGPLFIIIGMTAQMFLFIVPSILLIVVSVIAFGPWWGALYALIAVVVASGIGYIVGYAANESFVNWMLGKKTKEKLYARIEERGFLGVVVIARINPLLSNDAISFFAGLIKFNFWKFMGATVAGIIPLIAMVGLLGANMERLKQNLWILSGVVLLGFAGYYIYNRVKGN